jgi:hypothetical protein
MTRDKLEGFLIGLGAGILVGAYFELRESANESARENVADPGSDRRPELSANARSQAAAGSTVFVGG